MKNPVSKLFIFSILCIAVSFCAAQQMQVITYKSQSFTVLPDVMNKVNILSFDADGLRKNVTIDLDTFPTFSGFPIPITGQSVEGGIYCQMDGDAPLEIVYGIGNTVQAWKTNGTSVPGWPVTLSYNAEGAPAFGDIDGDGQAEIVINSRNFTSSAGAIYAFRKNGTMMPGFPIVNGAPSRTVVLADLDNDGKMEIITNKRTYPTGELSVYKGDGTVFPGWPKLLNHVPASSAAVGDITGDGVPEIIGESYNSLYAWDKNGNVLPGFPFTMPNGDNNSYSAPVLADMDGDNIKEIVFGTHVLGSGGYVYVIKNNGTVMTGWPKYASQWIYAPPLVGLIDNDNIPDVLVGDQVGSGVPADYVYGWNATGAALTGFPIGPIFAVNNQVSCGDIDGDGQYDLIMDDNTTDGQGRGKYVFYHTNGTPITGFPQYTTGTSFFNMPSLGDLNLDGKVDIVGAGLITSGAGTTNVYLWSTNNTYNPAKILNPVWQYNVRHSGVYGDNGLTSIQPVSNEIPKSFTLSQNYPNPFNPETKIRFSIPASANVKIRVYDLLGRLVTEPVNEIKQAGVYEFTLDASQFSSGVYFYQLTAGSFTDTRKMTVLK